MDSQNLPSLNGASSISPNQPTLNSQPVIGNQPITPNSPTPPPSSSKPKPSKSPTKTILAVAVAALVVLVGLGVSVYLTFQRQLIGQQARDTDQSVEAVCLPDGKVGLKVSFTNTEPNQANLAMDVEVEDLQTGAKINLGTVEPGATKTDTIKTDRNKVDAGEVRFNLSWSDGRSGTDFRVARYDAKECQPEVVVSCPLSPSGENDVLVQITTSKFLRADTTEADSQLSVSASIKPGTYKVTLASYDEHTSKQGQNQLQEQYFISLKNEGGSEITKSGSIADLPEDKDYLQQEVDTALVIGEAVTSITAKHTVYPTTTSPESIYPLCALFTWVEPETSPTPTPALTPTPSPKVSPTPTPTPDTDTCNDICERDNQCNQYNSNLICSSGRCRHKDNTGDTGCNVPTTYSCNSECSTNSQCQNANADYRCVQGNCRHKDNPASESCNPPIGGPQPSPSPKTVGFTSPTPTPETVSQVDLPEAGINEPTLTVIIFGGLVVLLGLGVLLVP